MIYDFQSLHAFLIPILLRRMLETKTELRTLIVGDKAELYEKNLTKKTAKETFKTCKKDILSSTFWSDLEYLRTIMKPILLFMRDNDNNCTLPAGNGMGHAYFNWWQLEQFYDKSNDIKSVHKKPLRKLVNDRWVFGHSILHSAGFMVHPAYRTCKQTTNEDVMSDWYQLLDMWIATEEEKLKILSQYMDYKQGKGLFNRSETSSLLNDPIAFWTLFGAGYPELQSLAIKILEQSTSASACETNWSRFEYIFSKRRNKLSNERVEKLVYVHGNLRNISNTVKVGSSSTATGSTLSEYLDSVAEAP